MCALVGPLCNFNKEKTGLRRLFRWQQENWYGHSRKSKVEKCINPRPCVIFLGSSRVCRGQSLRIRKPCACGIRGCVPAPWPSSFSPHFSGAVLHSENAKKIVVVFVVTRNTLLSPLSFSRVHHHHHHQQQQLHLSLQVESLPPRVPFPPAAGSFPALPHPTPLFHHPTCRSRHHITAVCYSPKEEKKKVETSEKNLPVATPPVAAKRRAA